MIMFLIMSHVCSYLGPCVFSEIKIKNCAFQVIVRVVKYRWVWGKFSGWSNLFGGSSPLNHTLAGRYVVVLSDKGGMHPAGCSVALARATDTLVGVIWFGIEREEASRWMQSGSC